MIYPELFDDNNNLDFDLLYANVCRINHLRIRDDNNIEIFNNIYERLLACDLDEEQIADLLISNYQCFLGSRIADKKLVLDYLNLTPYLKNKYYYLLADEQVVFARSFYLKNKLAMNMPMLDTIGKTDIPSLNEKMIASIYLLPENDFAAKYGINDKTLKQLYPFDEETRKNLRSRAISKKLVLNKKKNKGCN